MKAALTKYGVSLPDMMSRSRKAGFVAARRHVFLYLIQKLEYSYSQVAELFGVNKSSVGALVKDYL